jgi:acetylxylan esterase
MRSFVLLTGLASLVVAQKCAPVHMIVARGSFEAPGEGATAKLSTAVKKVLPGTTSEALDYPAKIPYNDQNSMAVGAANMKKAIAKYTTACPTSKIVLAGYSQGGSVTLDALCGGGGHPEIGPKTKGLTKEEGRNIKAVVAFGEPRFLAGMPYTAGTEKQKSGVSCPLPNDTAIHV